MKLKQILEFYVRAAKAMTHAIYARQTFGIYTKSPTLLLITKLGNHLMISGQPGMKKYRVIMDMTNNSFYF